jgi:Tol biopolymer transport system component
MPETRFEEEIRRTLREQADQQSFDPYSVKPTAKKARRRLERDGLIASVALVIIAGLVLASGPHMDFTTPAATPTVYPGQDGVIAFVDGNQVKIVHADGTGETTLAAPCTAESCTIGGITWSPSGTQLAFNIVEPNGNGALYLVNADGSGLQEVRGCPAGPPTWSTDGSRIATVAGTAGLGGRPTVYTCDAQGGGVRRMSFSADWCTCIVSWSPDGRELAYVGVEPESDPVVVESADGTDPRVIARMSGGPWLHSIAWSPDGRRIAFTSPDERSPDSSQRLWVVNADGGDPQAVLKAPWLGQATWSPDGLRLAVLKGDTSATTGSLIVMAPDGAGQTSLLPVEGPASAPAWDPSGNSLALFDHGDLVIVPADGSPIRRVATSTVEATPITPTWRPTAP